MHHTHYRCSSLLPLLKVKFLSLGRARCISANFSFWILSFYILAAALPATNAADVSYYWLAKRKDFNQVDAGSPTAAGDYAFIAVVQTVASNSVSSATLQLPSGITKPLSPAVGVGFLLDEHFESQADLDASYGTGNYVLTINTAHDGTKTLTLNLPPVGYPIPAHVNNYAAAQVIDPASDFSLSWDPLNGATTNDTVSFEIWNSDNDLVYRSPMFREPGVLNALDTSVIIPKNMLVSGQIYTIDLYYVKLGLPDTNSYLGAFGSAGYYSQTELGVITVPPQTSLSIAPAVRVGYSRSPGAIYQLQSSTDLVNWTNVSYAILGPPGNDTFYLPQVGTSTFFRFAAGDPANIMDFSQSRMLPKQNNMVRFENVLLQGKHYWVDYRATQGLRESAKGELPAFTMPRANITIDGDASDWAGIPALYTDPAHDQQPPDNHPGTDVKEFRMARDDQFIYVAYTLHDADPPADGTMYWCELVQYWQQLHSPGDTYAYAFYTQGAGWGVNIGHRESTCFDFFNPGDVGVGAKFIEFKVPVSQIEYDGFGLWPKIGIDRRFVRAYVHYVQDFNVNNPLSTYDGAGEDNKALIVDFYK